MKLKKIKVNWPNMNSTLVKVGDNWLEVASKAGVEIPTGCLTGSCGACEIEVNGKTIRACIEQVSKYKDSELNVELSYDPFW